MNALKGDSDRQSGASARGAVHRRAQAPPPAFIVEALSQPAALAADLATYPATRGSEELRGAIARWIAQPRFQARIDPATRCCPCRAPAKRCFHSPRRSWAGKQTRGLLPNPFYQIYEGAILLAGAEPYFLNTTAATDFLPDYRSVPESIWSRCELVYLCSPGNPTGASTDLETLTWLIEQADRYDFIIAADECYSEIYPDEQAPPPGLLQARRRHAVATTFAAAWSSTACPSARTCPVCGPASSPEMPMCWPTTFSTAPTKAAPCPPRCTARQRPGLGRRGTRNRKPSPLPREVRRC